MSSHTHQSKRPYTGQNQPSITSFFSPSTSSPSPLPQSTSAIPHQVQSSLLSVGMRVRKSVPEGYKTGAYSGFDLFTDSAMPNEHRSENMDTDVPQSKYKTTRPRAGLRELTPFCGILKTGGLAVQPEAISFSAEEEEYAEEYWPNSQESTGSFGGGNRGKRRFDDEESREEQEFDVRRGVLMDAGMMGGGRKMAIPRRRTNRKGAGGMAMGGAMGGDENSDMDFGEAEFLDYGMVGGGEEEEEVQMGGL